MDDLQGLALLFRGPTSSLASQVPSAERDAVVSRVAVWLLDQAIEHLRTAEQRTLATQIRALHLARARGQPIDTQMWDSRGANYLAGNRLWPPEWISSAMPGFPGIAHAATAAGLAIARHAYRQNHAYFRERQVACLHFWCVLHRSPSSVDEAALQNEARQGLPGPYCDWLAENDVDAFALIERWLAPPLHEV